MSKIPFSKENPDNSQKVGTIDDYTLGETLGRGTFGKVKLGTHKATSEKVAIKILEKAKLGDADSRKRVGREIKILQNSNHPHIIATREVIETQNEYYIVMEYVSGGELSDYIVAKKQLREDEACRLFKQIISAVEYLHTSGVAHRDLKPENILLDNNRNLKIIDFGLSNIYKKGEMLKTACGSPCFAAPEMIAGKSYFGLAVDIWSSGIILYLMLSGRLPFEEKNTTSLYKKILEEEPIMSKSFSSSAKDLIKNILNKDPSKRFTIKQIVEHSWYNFQGHQRKISASYQNAVNKMMIPNFESCASESLEVRKPIEENRPIQLTNPYNFKKYHLKKQYTEPVKENKAKPASPAISQNKDGDNSPFSNKNKPNNEAKSYDIKPFVIPKTKIKYERLNSLDQYLSTEGDKGTSRASLDKVIEKAKSLSKIPVSMQGSDNSQKIEIKDLNIDKVLAHTSLLQQNETKDTLNMISTRHTSDSNSGDSRRPKTDREKDSLVIPLFNKIKVSRQKRNENFRSCQKDEKSFINYYHSKIKDLNVEETLASGDLNSSYKTLQKDRTIDISSLNSIPTESGIGNESAKVSPYGLFKQGLSKAFMKGISQASDPNNPTSHQSKAYLSMKTTLRTNFFASPCSKHIFNSLSSPKTTKFDDKFNITLNTSHQKILQPDSKLVRVSSKQTEASLEEVKKLIKNSFGPKPFYGGEPCPATDKSDLTSIIKLCSEAVPQTDNKISEMKSFLNWRQLDSKPVKSQNESFSVHPRELISKELNLNESMATGYKKPKPGIGLRESADLNGIKRRQNTPTKATDLSASLKLKESLWPSPAVSSGEEQARLYNKFRKHMINM